MRDDVVHRRAAKGADMGDAKRRRAAGLTSPAPADSLSACLERARQLQLQGDALAALSQYTQLLAHAPDHVEGLRRSALALVELRQWPLAAQRLQRALGLQAQDAGLHYQLGRVQLLMGEAAPAIASFDAALRCDAAHVPTLYMRAATLEGLGDARGAAAGFLAAAALEPTRLLAHVGAARQLYQLNRLPDAEASQRRAAALDPRCLGDGVIGHALARPLDEPLAERRQRSAAACRAPAGQDALALADERELLVVDDFLAEPLAWRSHALAQRFDAPAQHVAGNFPGRQSAGGHADAACMQRIADLLGRDIKWSWPSHGAFRISPADARAHSDVHADHDRFGPAYAGVLYLSLPEHAQGGTSFWRHRDTGWSRVPSAAEVAASAYASYEDFMRRRRAEQGQRFELLAAATRGDWELRLEVPMRFNRLILYRSDYFHAISSLFGRADTDARLVQLFFFEPLGAPGFNPPAACAPGPA